MSKNVMGKETEIRRTFAITKMNIDLLDEYPPTLMPILALSKAPLMGAEVVMIINTEHVIDLLMSKDSS